MLLFSILSSFRFLASVSLILTSFCFAVSALADPVYRSTDKKGVNVYSSKPKEEGAEPAKLPNITKAKVGEVSPNNLSCAGHGGVNCQEGADLDGSVICYDSFKDSMQRFAFSCSAAKLVFTPESPKDSRQKFSLLVRNTSAVLAKGVKVSGPQGLVLEGPVELKPYDSASYSCSQEVARNARFQISCDNCP